MKKKIFICIIALVTVLIFFQVPNNLRYKIEKKFGEPNTFFYSVGLGIIKQGEGGAYDEEFELDDQNNISIDTSMYSDKTREFYIYGKYVNSSDPLVIVVNDKVIYNKKPQNDMANFYSHIYIKRHFVVNLTKSISQGNNKVILSTGKVTKNYIINSK
ncbi:hypothetical protein SAMN04487895_101585 [Paenibacillus sophorae]|uniref:Uncharacterized protein n=1 Tax=Paenibacillus sophorae TaxID=1333845 RepID=A0A1H8GNX4_9BACL|nr:hypothetical protein [Paenibacillus sophorae]QWU14287.1 hypothetical protein KP014_20485 [Paenibacillus sophorae]SEN45505.1 hypothetical protein SAMN04487895_101585 [Paenibacillus sophorae]